MADFDRRLIDPADTALLAALRKALEVANCGVEDRYALTRTAVDNRRLLAILRATNEGNRRWSALPPHRADVRAASLGVAWWTDHLGRKHVRVAGHCFRATAPDSLQEFADLDAKRPPLGVVYPDRVYIRHRLGQSDVLAACACGAVGTPEAIAWMGDCCGPCFDLLEERGPDSGPAFRASTWRGHAGPVRAVAVSGDGQTLASGGNDGYVRLWDAGSGAERRHFEIGGQVLAVALSPNGRLLAAANGRDRFCVWDAKTGAVRAEQSPLHPPSELAFSPDGELLASNSRVGPMNLWEVGVLPEWHSVAELSGGRGITFSPDGKLFASGGHDYVRVWDRETFALRTVPFHSLNPAECVALAGFAPLVAAGLSEAWSYSPERRCRVGEVRVVDRNTRQLVHVLAGHAGAVHAVAFPPHLKSLVSAGADGRVKLWNLFSGKEYVAFEWHRGAVLALTFSPDGQGIITGGADGVVKMWPWQALIEA